jgi:hypothetical protein
MRCGEDALWGAGEGTRASTSNPPFTYRMSPLPLEEHVTSLREGPRTGESLRDCGETYRVTFRSATATSASAVRIRTTLISLNEGGAHGQPGSRQEKRGSRSKICSESQEGRGRARDEPMSSYGAARRRQ